MYKEVTHYCVECTVIEGYTKMWWVSRVIANVY